MLFWKVTWEFFFKHTLPEGLSYIFLQDRFIIFLLMEAWFFDKLRPLHVCKREINTSFLCSPDLAICILFLKPGGMYASTRIRRDQARVEKPHRRATPKQIINQTVVSEAPNQHARLLVLERQAFSYTTQNIELYPALYQTHPHDLFASPRAPCSPWQPVWSLPEETTFRPIDGSPMLMLSENVRIFLCKEPISMRRSFEGLSTLVEQLFPEELFSGSCFVFLNKNRSHIKILFWDRDGFTIFYKRLEIGSFARIEQSALDRREFFMLLEGIEPKKIRRKFLWKIIIFPYENGAVFGITFHRRFATTKCHFEWRYNRKLWMKG